MEIISNILLHIKNIIRIVFIIGIILLVPISIMFFTSQLNWDLFDFAVIGLLAFSSATVYELIASNMKTVRQKVIIGTVIAMMLILIWIELAVGIFGTPLAGS